MIRPLVKYPGGKRSVIQQIDRHLPARAMHYFEPFVGGGAMYFHLASNDRFLGEAFLSDLNSHLIAFYDEVCRRTDHVLEEYEWLAEMSCRDAFYEVRDAFNADTGRDPIGQAARFLYITSHGFNGLMRYNKKGQCNVPYGGDERKPRPAHELRQSVNLMVKTAHVAHASFRNLPQEPGWGDLVYCDPPYTGTFDAYTQQGWDRQDDIALRDKCLEWRDNGADVVVSTNDPSLWTDEFNVEPIQTRSLIKSKERLEYVAF